MQSTDLHHQFQLLVQLLAILLVELVLEELFVLDLLKEVFLVHLRVLEDVEAVVFVEHHDDLVLLAVVFMVIDHPLLDDSVFLVLDANLLADVHRLLFLALLSVLFLDRVLQGLVLDMTKLHVQSDYKLGEVRCLVY